MSATVDSMTQIRWHSRGGQGGMTASQLLAEACFAAGQRATAFSFYGAERRGAPVTSYNRVADEPIKLYSQVRRPDLVVVLDDSLVDLESVTDGLGEDGTVVINTTDPSVVDFEGTVIAVDATTIAIDHGLQADGDPIVNTPMLGAVAATDLVSVEAVATAVAEEFGEENEQAVRAAYEQATEV